MEAQSDLWSGAIESNPGAKDDLIGAVEAQHGAMQAHPRR
jgi:hypothetical protein